MSVPRNQVTCLSVSTDGSVLLSGSHDETVRLWDTRSKQCIRTVTLKGEAPGNGRGWLAAPVWEARGVARGGPAVSAAHVWGCRGGGWRVCWDRDTPHPLQAP